MVNVYLVHSLPTPCILGITTLPNGQCLFCPLCPNSVFPGDHHTCPVVNVYLVHCVPTPCVLGTITLSQWSMSILYPLSKLLVSWEPSHIPNGQCLFSPLCPNSFCPGDHHTCPMVSVYLSHSGPTPCILGTTTLAQWSVSINPLCPNSMCPGDHHTCPMVSVYLVPSVATPCALGTTTLAQWSMSI